ncbi:MAG: energy-coupled thiamine transporter ThiT [Eubacteriaceae bacterium]
MSEEMFQSLLSTGIAKAGIVLIIMGFLLVIFLLTDKKREDSSPKALTTSGICIGIAFVLNQITLFKLPQGGSITPFSMLFIVLIGYCFGTRQGILAGMAFGLLDLLINPYVISPIQLLVDYPLAFGALGLGGLMKSYGTVIPAFLIGISGRFLCSFLSGFIFFGMYAPEGFNGFTWSLVYNGSYLGIEGILTLVFLCIPGVNHAIQQIKKAVAVSDSPRTA